MVVPSHAIAAGRFSLPPSADLFRLWRRSARALRAVGRRLDDFGAAAALPALGHVGHRQRAGTNASGRALVSAVAVRPLAWRQRTFVTAPLLEEPAQAIRIDSGLPLRRAKPMRWKTGRGG